MPLYPVAAPAYTPDPHFVHKRVTRIKKNFPRRAKPSRSPRRFAKATDCSCDESEDTKSMQRPFRTSGLKKSTVSIPALTESIIQDASIRMMLALEDERGEGNRNILDVRVRSLKKLFSSSDTESKISSQRFSTPDSIKSRSARSSIVSIIQYSPKKERNLKNSKTAEGIAGLLIKSIHTVPLENLSEDHETQAAISASADEQSDSEQNTVIEDRDKQEKKTEAGRKDDIRDSKAKEHDSSFEENTPSSNGFSDESSIDSAVYNVLRDSNHSSVDEVRSHDHSVRVTRADTFPPLKVKSRIRVRRADSDMCPLHEEDPQLVKYVSTNQISGFLGFTVKPGIDVAKEPTKKQKEILGTNEDVAQKTADSSRESSVPLATSTPVEDRPPFFSELQEREPAVIRAENEGTTDYDKCETPSEKHTYADDSEISASAYSILQSASDSEDKKSTFKRLDKEKRFSCLLEETDNVSPSDSFRDKEYLDKLGEYNVLKLSPSTRSLPSLQQFQFSTPAEAAAKQNEDNKATEESKTSSSIESLIRSSSNEVADVVHRNRQRRMLDLIRIIDTKMMVQPERYISSSNCRLRRKKRDRVYRNVNPRSLRKSLHTQFLKKRLQGHEHAEVMRVTSFPEDPSNKPLTPDSSSYNSSLESIITHDSLIRSRSHRATESFRSERNRLIRTRPAVDPVSHEAVKELTVDTQSSDSLRHISTNIEMKELKLKDTNRPSPDPVDHKSHSICDATEVSSHDEFTNITNTANITYNSCVPRPSPDHRQQDEASPSPSYPLPAVPSMVSKPCQLPTTKAQPTASLHRRSSDSDLSITPKGNSLGANDKLMTGLLKTSTAVIRTMNQDAFDMLEYPFITMQQYPPGFILHIGGLVSSRSVKLLERISNLEEPEGRDGWWKEIRMEVRSHARALACNVVIGYREETSICDDVCVLNAYGTAAVINLHNSSQDSDTVFISKGQSGSAINPADAEREKAQQKPVPVKAEKSETDSSAPITTQQTGKVRLMSESKDHDAQFQSKCGLCHLPYNEASVPFRVNVSKCTVCKRARVPDVLFTTIELPENVTSTGRGCIIQATACKSKKDLRGELNAKEISDCLPFLEYELHSLLLNKLKVKGMNAIFGLKLQVSVGERLIIGMAVGTAVFLTALPTPSIPRIASGNSWHKEEQLAEIQKTLVETVKKNREFYRLKPVADVENGRVTTSDTDESEDDLPDVDFSVGTRDTCVLEVDDIEDMDRISSLMDDRPPEDFHVVNTQTIPGLDELEIVRNLQMFTQISRTKIPAGQFASMPSKYFARLLQSVYFKLRRMIPCALCDMQFKLALPEPDEIQFTVIGMALGLGDPVKLKSKKKIISHSTSKDQVKKSDDSDMIFNLDVDHTEVSSDNGSSNITINSSTLVNTPGLKSRTRSPMRTKIHTMHKHKHVPLKGRYGVDITPLSYLPGGRIERYLGNLNFFFIRESTSIRENGGLSGFTHSFVMEVLAIVRAHITALGGNAMVAFFMTKCVLLHSPHKNQGQCLINVGGDVVSVSYFANEKHCASLNC